MVAPRMAGEGVRATVVEGRGFPSLIAVHQDATGLALELCLAIAKGIGSTRVGALASSFEEETVIDLYDEHQPSLHALRASFEALVEAGCTPEAVILDLYASGESVKWAEYSRDLGAFDRMKLASQTAQFGHLAWSKRYFDHDRAIENNRRVITAIKDGSFHDALKAQRTANLHAVDEAYTEAHDHPMIQVEDSLYHLLGRR